MNLKSDFSIKTFEKISIGTLLLEAPGTYNALSKGLVEKIEDALLAVSKFANKGNLNVLVIYGGGGAFSSGSNLKERKNMTRSEAIDFVDRLNDLFDRIEKLPVITVAAIQGAALGGGLELALSCDFRLASETSVLGLRETSLGIIPGAGGTYRLLRIVPESLAKLAVFSAKKFSATEAKEVGLVSEVFSEDKFLDHVYAYLQNTFSDISPFSVRQAKRAFEAFRLQYDKNHRHIERSFYLNTLYSMDRIEGLSAFLEKRNPQFTGDDAWMPES